MSTKSLSANLHLYNETESVVSIHTEHAHDVGHSYVTIDLGSHPAEVTAFVTVEQLVKIRNACVKALRRINTQS